MSSRSPSLRQISSYFAACASSSERSGASQTPHEYVIDGPKTSS